MKEDGKAYWIVSNGTSVMRGALREMQVRTYGKPRIGDAGRG
jgi:hypothetical protein